MVENKVYEFFTNHKVVIKATITGFVLAFLTLVIGYILAAIFGPTDFNIFNNTISQMGSSVFTPFPYISTTGNLISCPLFLPLTFYIRKQLILQVQKLDEKEPRIFDLAFIGMLMFFIGMMMTSVITLDVHRIIHTSIAIIAILGGLITTLSYGIIVLKYKTNIQRGVGICMIAIFPVVTPFFMTGFPSYIFYEWLLLFFLYVWIMIIAIRLLKKK